MMLFEEYEKYEISYPQKKNSRVNYLKYDLIGAKRKYICFFGFLFVLFVGWKTTEQLYEPNQDNYQDPCLGSTIQEGICNDVKSNYISGTLCMDLCITSSVYIPKCSEFASNKIQLYKVEKPDTTMICPINTYYYSKLRNSISQNDFRNIINQKIQKHLNYSLAVEELVNKLIDFGDINRDEELNLAEANSILLLLDNKHTLFQILFAEKSYASKIKSFCGGCIEVEQIENEVYLKKDSLIESVLNPWGKWPDWNYRTKISIGILEFFIDAMTLNPNDEFGRDSLYLCSSIEKSFGYTFSNEAKLINFNDLISRRELKEKLSNRKCKNDSDCIYNDHCVTTCDMETKKCTGDLTKLQLVDYCKFLRKYLLDNKNISYILEPLLNKCESLKPITSLNNIMFAKNNMPLNWNQHKDLIESKEYWRRSQQFTMLVNEMKATLWDWVKFVKDPIKPTKKTTKNSETTVKTPKTK